MKVFFGLLVMGLLTLNLNAGAAESCDSIFATSSTKNGIANESIESNILATQVVSELEKDFDQLLSNEGFASFESFMESARSKPYSRQGLAIKTIARETGLTFSMRANSLNREAIAKGKFLNQHESGQSMGAYIPGRRLMAEASMSGFGYEEYKKLPSGVRPKYGYLGTQIERNDGVRVKSYGDDIYRFKKDSVRNRVTYTIGDSLINMQNRLGRRISDQPGVDDQPPAGWSQIFIPWSRKGIAALFTSESLLNHTEITTESKTDGILPNKNIRDYVELQIWGELTLNDVESFAYTGRAPSGQFLKELKRRNIPIYKLNTKTGEFVLRPL